MWIAHKVCVYWGWRDQNFWYRKDLAGAQKMTSYPNEYFLFNDVTSALVSLRPFFMSRVLIFRALTSRWPMYDAAENWCERVFSTSSKGAWFCSFVFVRFIRRFYAKFQEIPNLKFRINISFPSESFFFMFIGQFLLCSIVDKWLDKYENDRRQDVEQGNEVKMLKHART